MVKTRRTNLRTFKAIERALKWGWTVQCRLLEILMPVGGVEVGVHDVRLLDPDYDDDDYQVLTYEGWRHPTTVWAIRPDKRKAKAVTG